MHAPRNTHRPHNHTAYTRYSYSCGHQSPSHTHTTDRHASTPTNSSLNGVHRRDDAALHSIIRSWALQLARHTRWSRRQAPHLAAASRRQLEGFARYGQEGGRPGFAKYGKRHRDFNLIKTEEGDPGSTPFFNSARDPTRQPRLSPPHPSA